MNEIGDIYRREVGRCTATLIRVLGDIDLAEDAVADAFTIAADVWRRQGIPANPGAWITTTARNRAIDRLRRESTREQRQLAATQLISAMEPCPEPDFCALDDLVDVVADDQLRLLFLCCHPALAVDAQVALTLRLVGGLETPEIACAFVVPEATMAQRLVRAKRKLRVNHAPYRIPRPAELPDRLTSVLATIYLIFTEGHSASSGDELTRADLTGEALRLGFALAELMPDEPEVAGLVALMVFTQSRAAARCRADGSMVRLSEQDRTLWDRDLIDQGVTLLNRFDGHPRPGLYRIQAMIGAIHAEASSADRTDWPRIVACYDLLVMIHPTAVVALNRAVAIAQAFGAQAGVDALDAIDAKALDAFQPYHATRADLLIQVGRKHDALAAYDRAIALSTNPVEAQFLATQRDIATQRDTATNAKVT